MPTATIQTDDTAPVLLLRADVWRQRMLSQGYPTVTAQARAAGLTRQTLSEMLNGHAGPAPATARRMVRVAKLHRLDHLFEMAAA